eukprot:4261485-Alexandrium_andersonii.AAC.1
MPLDTSGRQSSLCIPSVFHEAADAGCPRSKRAPLANCASRSLITKSRWIRAPRLLRSTSYGAISGRFTRTFSEHLSVRGGLPIR